jgi:hypothetical protein
MNRPSVNEYFPSSKEGIAFVKTAFPATEATNSQRMKSISFSEELEFTQETLGLDDYNEEEISDVWYSREDYLAFKLDARRQAKVIRVSYAKFVASIEQAYSFCDDVANEMGEEAAMEMTLKRIVSFNDLCWWGYDYLSGNNNRIYLQFISLFFKRCTGIDPAMVHATRFPWT